jgi:hypothetical protein
MSNVNVRRLVENIRSGTNIYTPLVELIVNAIQAIDAKGLPNGLVEIEVLRNGQADVLDRLEDVDGFVVKDNGIGCQSASNFDPHRRPIMTPSGRPGLV